MTSLAPRHDGSLPPLVSEPCYDDFGRQFFPDAATLTITDEAGNAFPLAGSPTVDAAGRASYAWSEAETAGLLISLPSLDWRALWTFDVGGTDHDRLQYFDILEWDIRSAVTEERVIAQRPQLAAKRPQRTGVATGGSTTTLIDTARLRSDSANALAGSTLSLRTGGSDGHDRRVTASDPVTGTLTFDPAVPNDVESGDAYDLILSLQPQIREAWRSILRRIRDTWGRDRSARLLDGADFDEAHLFESVAMACRAFTAGKNDPLTAAGEDFAARAETALRQTFIRFENSVGEAEMLRPRLMWGR